MKKKTRCPLVMVEWVDSAQPRSRWEYLANIGASEGVRCASVGWLVSDGKRNKALAPNMGALDAPDSLQVCGVITIPTRSITKITRLKEPKRPQRRDGRSDSVSTAGAKR